MSFQWKPNRRDYGVVDPKWKWFWDNLEFGVIVWRGGAYEIVQRQYATVGGTPSIAEIQDGVAYDMASAGDYLSFASQPNYNILYDMTLIWHGVIDTGSAYRHFCGKHAGNGGTNNPFDFRTDNSATPNCFLVRSNASGAMQYVGPATTLGSLKTYAVTQAGGIENDAIFYRDGSPTSATPVGAQSGLATTNASVLRVGQRIDAAVQLDGKMSVCYGLSCALNERQHKLIARDPFGPLRRSRQTPLFVPVTGGIVPRVHHQRYHNRAL